MTVCGGEIIITGVNVTAVDTVKVICAITDHEDDDDKPFDVTMSVYRLIIHIIASGREYRYFARCNKEHATSCYRWTSRSVFD